MDSIGITINKTNLGSLEEKSRSSGTLESISQNTGADFKENVKKEVKFLVCVVLFGPHWGYSWLCVCESFLADSRDHVKC